MCCAAWADRVDINNNDDDRREPSQLLANEAIAASGRAYLSAAWPLLKRRGFLCLCEAAPGERRHRGRARRLVAMGRGVFGGYGTSLQGRSSRRYSRTNGRNPPCQAAS